MPTPELVAETARALCGRGERARRWPPVIMPALGVAQETGRIVEWLAVEGDTVTEGEPLFEIETDKVTVSIDAPASGSFRRSGRTTATRCRSGGSSRTSSHPGRNHPMPWRAKPPPTARPNRSRRPHPTANGSRPRVSCRPHPDPATGPRHPHSRGVGRRRLGSNSSRSAEQDRAEP